MFNCYKNEKGITRIIHKMVFVAAIGVMISTIMGTYALGGEKKGKIGILPKSIGHDWFCTWVVGGKWYLESHGYEVTVGTPKWDAAKQITIMRTWAMDPNIDGVIVSCVGSEACSVGIKALADAGKIVIVTDAEGGYSRDEKLCVAYPVYQASYDAGMKVVEMLKDKYGQPKGTVVLGVGNVTDTNHLQRAAGFRDALKKYPDIEINEVPTGTSNIQGTAATRLRSLIRTLPKIDAILSIHMPEFQGFITAVKDENLAYPIGDSRHIIIVGVDSSPAVINPGIREKIVDFAIDQPVLGYNAIGAYYLLKILEEGDGALPKIGETIYLKDLPIKTTPPYKELTFLIPSDSWAPAKVLDTRKKLGHITIQTHYRIVDSTNVDDPTLWSNFSRVMDENNLSYGF